MLQQHIEASELVTFVLQANLSVLNSRRGQIAADFQIEARGGHHRRSAREVRKMRILGLRRRREPTGNLLLLLLLLLLLEHSTSRGQIFHPAY